MTGYVWLRRVSIPRQWGDVTLECGAILDDGVVLLSSGITIPDKIHIKGVYVNRYTMLDAHAGITIEDRCMIGPCCYITDADHGMAKDRPVAKQAKKAAPATVERNAWLGAAARFLKGATVGEGAVVAAGAVVTKNVDAWSIVAGVPAKVIRKRA